MKGNSELAARAARLAKRQPGEAAYPKPEPGTAGPVAKPQAPRTKPVRLTTDVAPQTHRMLARIAADLAEQTGLPRVNYTDILRALVAELESSKQLQAAVAERISSSVAQ